MERLGTVIVTGSDFQEAVDRVRLADELGYESAWVTDGMGRDAFVVLTAFAAATKRIKLGTSIVTIYPRHPTVMARHTLSLDEISGGRFILGIGTGHKASMEGQLGLQMGDPIAAIREYTAILRQAFEGKVNHHGEHWNVEWSYPFPAKRPLPIIVAALNPPLMEAAGEFADGVVLWMASADYVRDVVVPRVKAGRERAGKPLEGFEIIAPIPAAITDDVEAATKALHGEVARYGGIPFYRREYINSGFRAEADAIIEARDKGGDPAAAVSPKLADALGKVGSKAEVQAFIKRFRDAGATLPIIRPIYGPSTERTLHECVGA